MRMKPRSAFLTLVALFLCFHPAPTIGGGITIITHGFTFDDDDPQHWIHEYADAVAARTGDASSVTVYRIDFDYQDLGDTHTIQIGSVTWLSGPIDVFTGSSGAEVVFVVNWSQCAARRLNGEAVSSVVIAQILVEYFEATRISSHAWIEQPIHLIGHSRGASVIAELAKRFGSYGIWVDQQTTLDPHPVNNDGNIDSVATVDASVNVYENTIFADNYWENTYAGTIAATYPAGRAIVGALDRNLNSALIADGLPNNSLPSGLFDDHSRVYDWYFGTLNSAATQLLSDSAEAIPRSIWYANGEANGANCGFIYSRIARGTRPATGLNSHFGGNTPGQSITRNTAVGSQWPNVFDLKISDSQYEEQAHPQYQIGCSLPLRFVYQSFESQAFASVYLDPDQNPYNGNSVDISGSYISCPANGSALTEKMAQWNTTGRTPGIYYLYAKIEDGFGHVRFVYANKQIQLVTTTHDLNFYKPSTWPIGFFLNNSSAGLTSMTTFSPSDSIHISFAFKDDEWNNISQAICVRLVLSAYPPTFNYPPNYLGFNLPVSKDFVWVNGLQGNYYGSVTAWQWTFFDWYVLRNLPVGTYTLSCSLNADNAILENDYSNNTRNITFTVALPETTPPTPDPMTWSIAPYATGTTSIRMTATTANDANGVEYYFDETSGNPGGTDSGWQDSATYEDTGLNPNTSYTYRVKARDKSPSQNTTGYSTAQMATTVGLTDTTPPSPDPLTWSIVPHATGATTIRMTATTANDANGVEYYFDETSGNPGGTDSGWQDCATYEDTGLNLNTSYTYRVKARDKSPNQNTTGYSTAQMATPAPVPTYLVITLE